MSKRIKVRLGAAVLTAAMAVSAVPMSNFGIDVFSGNVLSAHASGCSIKEDGVYYDAELDDFQPCEGTTKYKANCNNKIDGIKWNIINAHIYADVRLNSKGVVVGFSNEELVFDDEYKSDERFSDLLNDNHGWPREDFELADSTPEIFAYYEDPDTGIMWFTNSKNNRIWYYENGERVYYVDKIAYTYSNYARLKTLSSAPYKVTIDKDTGLEKIFDAESGYNMFVVFSEKQLQTAIDSAPENQEGSQIDTHIYWAKQSSNIFTKGVDITNGRKVEITGNINGSMSTLSGEDKVNFFRIEKGCEAVIRDFYLVKGYASDGGAVYNDGDLYLYNCDCKQNKANNGGSIYNGKDGTARIFNDKTDSMMRMVSCSASFGGAIYNDGKMYVGSSDESDIVIDCNNVTRSGGGIFNNGELHVYKNVIIKGCKATTSEESSENQGGGIYNSGTAYVHGAKISGNHADNGGGGIFTTHELHLDGASITGNFANEKGAGVYASADVYIDGALDITGNKNVNGDSITDSNVYIDNYASEGATKRTYLTVEDADNKGTGIDGSIIGVTVAEGPRDFTTRYGKIHKDIDPSSYLTSDNPDYSVIWNSKKTEATLGQQVVERLAGTTLSLEGDICINFHMSLEDVVVNDKTAYMEFAIPTSKENEYEIRRIPVSEAIKTQSGGNTYYVFKCRIPAKKMSSKVRAQLVYSNGEKKGKDYKYDIESYAEEIIDNDNNIKEYEKAAPLMEAMLNYGAYAQVVFKYNTDNLANKYCEKTPDIEAAKTALAKWDYSKYKNEKLPEGVTYETSSFELDSMVNLRMYFKSAGALNAELTSYGTTRKAEGEGSFLQCVKFDNIKPNEYDQILEIKINDDYSMKYCPLTYCYEALTSGVSGDVKNVVAALYEYYVAVKDYAMSVNKA